MEGIARQIPSIPYLPTKIMAVADAGGLPFAIHMASASPHEVTLVEETLKCSFIDETPEKLIGDKAYDSDKLDSKLALEWGIEEPQRVSQNARWTSFASLSAPLEG